MVCIVKRMPKLFSEAATSQHIPEWVQVPSSVLSQGLGKLWMGWGTRDRFAIQKTIPDHGTAPATGGEPWVVTPLHSLQ